MTDKSKPDNTYIVTGATALYPRLNKTKKFVKHKDGTQERIDCAPTDLGAEYTMSLALTKEQAVPLYSAMKSFYELNKQPDWIDFLPHSEIFEAGTDHGLSDNEWVVRTKLPGSFGDELTSVSQFDAGNNVLPKDFMLTTNSKINVLVSLVVYEPSVMKNKQTCGISLRLRHVQVIDLAELKRRSPFDVVEGGFNSTVEGFATGFETASDKAAEAPEEFAAPAPKKSKPVAKAKPQTETKKVEDYNDIDEALDNLEFEDA